MKANKLWLENILADIYVDKLATKYDYHEEPFKLVPIIGEYDDPNNQRQDLLTINLTSDGNTSIYGSSWSGKELLLSSMIYSLCINYTADDIKELIMNGASSIEIKRKALDEGYQPLIIDGINKVLLGNTTIEELDKKIVVY